MNWEKMLLIFIGNGALFRPPTIGWKTPGVNIGCFLLLDTWSQRYSDRSAGDAKWWSSVRRNCLLLLCTLSQLLTMPVSLIANFWQTLNLDSQICTFYWSWDYLEPSLWRMPYNNHSVRLSAKTLSLVITFDWLVLGLSYFTSVFLLARPFIWCHGFDPLTFDLVVWPTFQKL
jgi:hypothetical protein